MNKSPLAGAEVLINIRGYWTCEAAVKLMERTQIKLGLKEGKKTDGWGGVQGGRGSTGELRPLIILF